MELIQTGLLFVILIIVAAGLRKNHKRPAAKTTGSEVLIDTCALIDGRILELAKTGFIPGLVLVPKFVIAELQYMADGRDATKRERARYGLDMIKALQNNDKVTLKVINEDEPSVTEVDDKLIKLAHRRGSSLFTTDYNLNKVADIEGVTVLNVNELAQMLKPQVLPGESLTVKIVQKGNERDQGVGYLVDGTMVVVNGAASMQGQEVTAKATRSLQTQAGRMVFAELNKQVRPAKKTQVNNKAAVKTKPETVPPSGKPKNSERSFKSKASQEAALIKAVEESHS